MKKSVGQNNCLLNNKIKNSSVNNKQLFPNLHLVKNVRKKNEKNIYSKIKILPKKKERFLSQTIINDYNDINNNKVKVGINDKKMKLHISQSEKNINDNNDNNDGDNKDYINSIFNNGDKITSKKFLKSYDISKNSENKNNLSSHNEIISDLLNKTEKFFENLGVFLEERNKKYFDGNKNNFKTKKVYGFTTKRNNLVFNSSLYNKRKIINNYSDKNFISLRNYTILNNLNQNKSISTINLHNDDNNKKSVSDAIIQTLNTSDDNKQNIKQEEDQEQQQDQEQIQNKRLKQEEKRYEVENRNERNNILPLLTKSLDIIEPNKREVKIAEVKKVYPVYPFNRIIQLNPSLDKNNKYNFNIHRKVLLDMRDVFRHDDKYNYQQLMNNFKYKSVNKKNCFVYSYKLKSSFSYKKISREKIKLIK